MAVQVAGDEVVDLVTMGCTWTLDLSALPAAAAAEMRARWRRCVDLAIDPGTIRLDEEPTTLRVGLGDLVRVAGEGHLRSDALQSTHRRADIAGSVGQDSDAWRLHVTYPTVPEDRSEYPPHSETPCDVRRTSTGRAAATTWSSGSGHVALIVASIGAEVNLRTFFTYFGNFVSYFDRIDARIETEFSGDFGPGRGQKSRALYAMTEQLRYDDTGRIVLSPTMRDMGELGGTALLMGAGDYFEIWQPELFLTQDGLDPRMVRTVKSLLAARPQ